MESKLILSSVGDGIKYPCIMQHKQRGTVAMFHSNTSGVVLVAAPEYDTSRYSIHNKVGMQFANMSEDYDPTRHWTPLPKGSKIVITV